MTPVEQGDKVFRIQVAGDRYGTATDKVQGKAWEYISLIQLTGHDFLLVNDVRLTYAGDPGPRGYALDGREQAIKKVIAKEGMA